MTGAEIKRISWQQRRSRASTGPSAAVDKAMLALARPATTREIAEAAGIPLPFVRPCVSALRDLGFAECAGRRRHEGLYRAIAYAEARKNLPRRITRRLLAPSTA